jgi:hypothetical protein
MKQLLFITLMLASTSLFAQADFREQSIRVMAGYTRTGSGDMGGLIYGAEWEKFFRYKVSWSLGFNGLIYDGENAIYTPNDPNRRSDGGLRYTTAGVQVVGHLGYSFIKTPVHDFKLRVGPLVKYQTSSLDGYAVTYPLVTNYPEPVVTFYNPNPQRTVALGGSVQILYNYTIRNKISVGVLAGGQTDTEGDLITQLSVMVGRKF